MMLMPYRMETAYTRIPYSNASLVAIISLIFFFIAFGLIPEEDAARFILRDWDLSQLIGNTFLHGGFFHLLGNMIFLWVFGNVVCGTVGNIAFPFLYLFLGLAASAAHMAFDGRPALGASGAINGIVGMALILFPVNRLKCWYAFSMPFMGIMWKSGTFTTKSYWMIFAWAVFDILGVIFGGGNIAYWAHIGGFVMGMLLASSLVLLKVVETYDPTLFDIVQGRPAERTTYSLEEIATMPAADPVLGVVTKVVDLNKPQARTAPAQPQIEPVPLLRITRMAEKEGSLTIFFVNDGDAVRDISLTAPEGMNATIQPMKGIARREMGSMRLTNICSESLCKADLKFSFAFGGGKVTRQLCYEKDKNRLVVT